MIAVAIVGGILGTAAVVMGGISMSNANKKAKRADELAQDNLDMQSQILVEQLAFQKEQQAALDKQKDIYRAMEFTNPYENMENAYAENVYEDMTVNQQQAQFQAQQGTQQRSNIMQGLKGAAGGSGIAGLAQAMASQGQLQNQQISAQIGMQESQQQALKAKGARDKQAGASAVDMAERGGEALVQEMETSRQSTLLGMQMGQTAGANAAVQQGYANQMSAGANQANMMGQQAASQYAAGGQMISSGMNMMGDMTAAGAGSDRRLKKNITKIGESSRGFNIYSFEYKNPTDGEGLFQGVMSDEIPQEAVSKKDGYDYVDYSMLDVEFKQI